MPFTSPLIVTLVDDRDPFPWALVESLPYDCPLTGATYVVPAGFRTDGSSVPESLLAIPVVGALLFSRYFDNGLVQGFREGALHDYLRRGPNPPVPALMAHKIFREALYAAGYPEDMCETYYAAVKAFNSGE